MADRKVRNFYVYVHKRASDGTIFYVGKGNGKRAWETHNRSTYWRRIAAKHGYVCEIVASGLHEWYAIELEREWILRVGRDRLCNMTDGGEGVSGRVVTDAHRQKLSDANKRRMADGLLGPQLDKARAARVFSDEYKRRISLGLTGKKASEETRKKMSESRLGKKMPPRTPEHRKKISDAKRGAKHSEELKRRRGEAVKAVRSTPESKARTSQATRLMWARKRTPKGQTLPLF